MAGLASDSIQLVITSQRYWQLADCGVLEIGFHNSYAEEDS